MKHIIISLLLIISLAGFCIWSSVYVENITLTTEQLVRNAASIYQFEETAVVSHSISQASAYWKQKQCILGILISHDAAENIQQSLTLLQSYMDDPVSFFATSNLILFQLEAIRDMEQAQLKNIL